MTTVSLLSMDLSTNCVGRPYELAQVLEQNYDVEIIGPRFLGTVWEPLRGKYAFKGVDTSPQVYEFPFKTPQLLEQISGDVVYAVKPKTSSYGVGLLETLGNDRPLVLDIDDWEAGFEYDRGESLKGTVVRGLSGLLNVDSFFYTRILESAIGLADERTVSNRRLQERFGGTNIAHPRDLDFFDPSKYDQSAVRRQRDLPLEKTIVMFAGTPRPHKGVDDLARAVAGLERDDIVAVVVGAHDSEYVREVQRIGGDRIIVHGRQPFDELPAWIAAADIVTAPQKQSPAGERQSPAKVFDGMSMAKPVIGTDISMIPDVLEGCGVVVPPDSPTELAAAIELLADDPERRSELGRKARQRIVDEYSYEALGPVMEGVIERSLSA